jgi:hypothetical protein
MHTKKEWEDTMTRDEVSFCLTSIWKVVKTMDESCVDNFRAARLWKSSQRRRYYRDRATGCCGFYDNVIQRWNPEKERYDLYMIGFNYGH